MRIPSQFNEDSLYRRDNRRADSAHASRRLVRLVIGLALVIVVMRQASKPEMYRTLFGPPALNEVDPSTNASIGSEHAMHATKAPISPEDRHSAHLLAEQLSPAEQRQWLIVLSRWQAGQMVEFVPPSIQSVQDRLETLDFSDEQRLSWQVMLDSLVQSTAAPDTNGAFGPTSIEQPRVAAFIAVLDDAAAARVVDGSVWRSGDFDSFYRYLDQAESLQDVGIATTGVLPLLQQPDVFRNQLVRARGGVVRAERIDARENPYGINQYWQLWIRPADGADRPLIAIVSDAPAWVRSVGPNANEEDGASGKDGPQVTIVGRFLKRLAYKSAIGADLAPVVIGRIVSAPRSETELNAVDPAETGALTNRSWITIGIACLAGFALAAIAMWRTSAAAKRVRQLRTAHPERSAEFLKGLVPSADQPTSPDQRRDLE